MANVKMPSMQQLADELGLSRLTVSSIVNGRAEQLRISKQTINRVRTHLAKRGYVPSRHARNLRSAPEKVIGILHVEGIVTHLVQAFNQLIHKFSGGESGLELMVTPHARVKDAVCELLARRVTDLVWIHNNSAVTEYADDEIYNYLKHMRTVVYNHNFSDQNRGDKVIERGISLVGVDRNADRRRMAQLLYRNGHRRIALPDVVVGSDDRQNSYGWLFREEGLDVISVPYRPMPVEQMPALIKKEKITALHFNGDTTACLAIDGLRSCGIVVPDDLTVTGFDGTSIPFGCGLTTLSMPVEAMVGRVGEILAGGKSAGRHCFEMELIEGRTHDAPAAG